MPICLQSLLVNYDLTTGDVSAMPSTRKLDYLIRGMLGYNRRVKLMNDNVNQTKAGIDIDPVIDAYKKDVDRTLIRENLRLTVDERFQQLMKLQHFAEELRRAGKEAES